MNSGKCNTIFGKLVRTQEMKAEQLYLIAEISNQKLYVMKETEIMNDYNISTSKYGIGNQEGSFRTPLGTHRIIEKIGEGVPICGIFKKRKFTGKITRLDNGNEGDLITSRIFVLAGLERKINLGRNIDSLERGIFIHGTQQENLIGKPASHGCIRMRNKEIMELFYKIEIGSLMEIIR